MEGSNNHGNGTATPYSGMIGPYIALNPTMGRFTDTATINSRTDHHVAYAVSGSQYLQMCTGGLGIVGRACTFEFIKR